MNKTPKQLALAAVLAAAPLAANAPPEAQNAPLAAKQVAVWENTTDEFVSITVLDHPDSAGFLVVDSSEEALNPRRSLILMSPKVRAAVTANHLRYPISEKRASNLMLAPKGQPNSKVYVKAVQSRGPITPAFGPKWTFHQRLAVDFQDFNLDSVNLSMEQSPQTRDAVQTRFVLKGGNWKLPEEAARIGLKLLREGRSKRAGTLDVTILPGQEAAQELPQDLQPEV